MTVHLFKDFDGNNCQISEKEAYLKIKQLYLKYKNQTTHELKTNNDLIGELNTLIYQYLFFFATMKTISSPHNLNDIVTWHWEITKLTYEHKEKIGSISHHSLIPLLLRYDWACRHLPLANDALSSLNSSETVFTLLRALILARDLHRNSFPFLTYGGLKKCVAFLVYEKNRFIDKKGTVGFFHNSEKLMSRETKLLLWRLVETKSLQVLIDYLQADDLRKFIINLAKLNHLAKKRKKTQLKTQNQNNSKFQTHPNLATKIKVRLYLVATVVVGLTFGQFSRPNSALAMHHRNVPSASAASCSIEGLSTVKFGGLPVRLVKPINNRAVKTNAVVNKKYVKEYHVHFEITEFYTAVCFPGVLDDDGKPLIKEFPTATPQEAEELFLNGKLDELIEEKTKRKVDENPLFFTFGNGDTYFWPIIDGFSYHTSNKTSKYATEGVASLMLYNKAQMEKYKVQAAHDSPLGLQALVKKQFAEALRVQQRTKLDHSPTLLAAQPLNGESDAIDTNEMPKDCVSFFDFLEGRFEKLKQKMWAGGSPILGLDWLPDNHPAVTYVKEKLCKAMDVKKRVEREKLTAFFTDLYPELAKAYKANKSDKRFDEVILCHVLFSRCCLALNTELDDLTNATRSLAQLYDSLTDVNSMLVESTVKAANKNLDLIKNTSNVDLNRLNQLLTVMLQLEAKGLTVVAGCETSLRSFESFVKAFRTPLYESYCSTITSYLGDITKTKTAVNARLEQNPKDSKLEVLRSFKETTDGVLTQFSKDIPDWFQQLLSPNLKDYLILAAAPYQTPVQIAAALEPLGLLRLHKAASLIPVKEEVKEEAKNKAQAKDDSNSSSSSSESSESTGLEVRNEKSNSAPNTTSTDNPLRSRKKTAKSQGTAEQDQKLFNKFLKQKRPHSATGNWEAMFYTLSSQPAEYKVLGLGFQSAASENVAGPSRTGDATVRPGQRQSILAIESGNAKYAYATAKGKKS